MDSQDPLQAPTREDPLSSEEAEAIARLQKLADHLTENPSRTMAGLPGNFEANPFALSRKQDKTAAIERNLLQELATSSSEAEDLEEPSTPQSMEPSAPSSIIDPWKNTPTKNNKLASEEKAQLKPLQPDQDSLDPAIDLLHDNAPESQTNPSLRDTRENKSIPRALAKAAAAKDASKPGAPEEEKPTVPALNVNDLFDPPVASKKKAPSPAPKTKSDAKPSLAVLFKKAKKRRESSAGAPLKTPSGPKQEAESIDSNRSTAPSSAKAPDTGVMKPPPMEISPGEIAELVEKSPSRDESTVSPADKTKELPTAPSLPVLPRASKPIAETEHSGLFKGFPSTAPSPPRGAVAEVSRRPGQNTTQSMLARLQKRRTRGKNIDPLEVGAAGERRGSGYIRLPTSEIQEVLGHGDFRLRIQDVIYEPVDREGLTQLIKSGVLMGAEELAEADGDWMPISEHPVFGELRRKMAAEAHQVLSRLGATQRVEPEEPQETSPKIPLPALPKEEETLLSVSDIQLEPERGEDSISAPLSEVEPALPPVEKDSSFENFFDEDSNPLPVPEPAAEVDFPGDSQTEIKSADALPISEPPVEPEVSEVSEYSEEIPPTPERIITEPEPAPELLKPSSKAPALIAAMAVLLAIGAAGLFLTEPGKEVLQGFTASSEQGVADSGEPSPSGDQELAEVVAHAQETLEGALPDAYSEHESAAEGAHSEDTAEALNARLWEQWQAGDRDSDFLQTLFTALIEDQHFQTARKVAKKGRELYPEEEAFQDLHRQAIDEDAALHGYHPEKLISAEGFSFQGLYDVSNHRGFLIQGNSEAAHLLVKPEFQNGESLWRAEIAAWRLCELIICHFEIFPVRSALLTRDFLEELGGNDEDLQPLLEEIRWQEIEIDGVSYLAAWGSIEERPVAASHPFPIEFRSLWLNWLAVGSSPALMEEPLAENLGRVENFADGHFHAALLESLGDVPTSAVARQVSSLLLFDFLTNNWERFFTRTEDYGTNNPVFDGEIVSLHNGEAFQPRASRRVQGRFEWTSRFSASTVESIRSLEREFVNSILFPEATAAERARLDMLWSQRGDLLQRVDSLEAQHGSNDVLLFP